MKKKSTPKPKARPKAKSTQRSKKIAVELDDDELGKVGGGSFDVENPTTIGSGTSGAGAGKIKFDPFSITRKIDRASPNFFK